MTIKIVFKQVTKKIPVNIITGFLGVGKTTTIRHLLKTKPKAEKWAVLVNEFGEVGIDGAILDADGVAVKEVAGGCICCSVSLPSSVALNNLLEEVKPDRVIIEPTGLAMPKQITKMLSSDTLKNKVEIQATICLVDPWCFHDKSFLSIPTFIEQISDADVLVASKADTANTEHLSAFIEFADEVEPAKQGIYSIANGELDWQCLTLPHLYSRQTVALQNRLSNRSHKHAENAESSENESDNNHKYDKEGVAKIENKAEFGFSCGWIFDGHWQFDINQLEPLITGLSIPRVKGVFATQDGWVVINKMRKNISKEYIEYAADSRVEMISLETVDWADFDNQIRQCSIKR